MARSGVEQWTGADGRRKIIAEGTDASRDVMIRHLRDTGAKEIGLSWSSPLVAADDDDAPPGVPVTWACTVVFHQDRHPRTVGASEPTANHSRGIVEALADVMRQIGANVVLTGPTPDGAEGL